MEAVVSGQLDVRIDHVTVKSRVTYSLFAQEVNADYCLTKHFLFLARLGSLTKDKPDDQVTSPNRDTTEPTSPLLQRVAIIQKDEKGYGLTVSGDNPVYVASVKPGGAAAKAGVQMGDKIIKVNGKLVINSNHPEVVKLIKLLKPQKTFAQQLPMKVLPADEQKEEKSMWRSNVKSGFEVCVECGGLMLEPVSKSVWRSYAEASFQVSVKVLCCSQFPSQCGGLMLKPVSKSVWRSYAEASFQFHQRDPRPKFEIFLMNGYVIDCICRSVKVENEENGSVLFSERWGGLAGSYVALTLLGKPSTSQPSHSRESLIEHREHPNRDSISIPQPVDAQKDRELQQQKLKTLNAMYDATHEGYEKLRKSCKANPGDAKLQEQFRDKERTLKTLEAQINALSGNDTQLPPTISVDSSEQMTTDSGPSGTASVPYSVSDVGSDSPCTSPSSSPTPTQNPDIDPVTADSGIEDGSQNSIVMMRPSPTTQIIGAEDDDFASEDECFEGDRRSKPPSSPFFFKKHQQFEVGDNRIFADMQTLEKHAAHMAVFLHWVISFHNPAPILFYTLSGIYSSAQGGAKDLKKWAYEIHSTFIIHMAPLKVNTVPDYVIEEIDKSLMYRAERLLEGAPELKDSMDRNEEMKVVDKYLVPDLEKSLQIEDDEKHIAQTWALATFLRNTGHSKAHTSLLERTLSFTHKGHNFVLTHLTKQEFCLTCNKVLWGVGPQGYQCQTCDQCVHKTCVEDLSESCSKKDKKNRSSMVNPFNKKLPPTPGSAIKSAFSDFIATASQVLPDMDQLSHQSSPGPLVNTLQGPVDQDLSAFKEQGHSVNKLVTRFENRNTIEKMPCRLQGSNLSVNARGKVQKRSLSDLKMDENTLRTITPGSSTTSIKSQESPSNSMDTLTAQIQEDSDFEVEAELPSLKQVLGEDTVRKLKPKEKKRQDVINGALNKSMKERRKEKSVVTAVGDLLLQRFDNHEGENFKHGCAVFCRNQSHMLEQLKLRLRKETKTAQLLADAENNPLCQRLALRDIIPKQFMRLTKYPLLIENLMKYTSPNTDEYRNLELSLKCSKRILTHVNQEVKVCENRQRLVELHRRIDKKSIDNSSEADELRELDIRSHNLVHDGPLIWNINNRKQIEVHLVLLEKAMVILQKQEDRLVLKLQNTQLVAGRTEAKKHSPLLWLNNVLARNDATDKKAFFVVNTSKAGPQIYKLLAGTAEEQRIWTKYITQASEAQKRAEINKNKAPVQEQTTPTETIVESQVAQEERGEIQDLDADNIVHPEDITFNAPDINTAVQVITPLEKLRQNDENLAMVLEERQGLIAEILNIPQTEVANKVQDVVEEGEGEPNDLIAACQHQTTEIFDLMKDSPTPLAVTESGERIESVEDLTLPIPMDKLRDMANRMNQILTNLLAQTRATANPMSASMSQAAVNSQNEERDRLRRELKFAQEELNRLRRIQKIQMEAQQEGGDASLVGISVAAVTGSGEKAERPASLVSEASTVSESEDSKTDSEQAEDPIIVEVAEDNMPGLPIDPEETGPLNETPPGGSDSLVDDTEIDYEENAGAEVYKYDDAEQLDEALHEVEPPDEDHLEDLDTPVVEIQGPESDLNDDDDDHEDDEETESEQDVDAEIDEGKAEDEDDTEGDSGTDTVNAGTAESGNSDEAVLDRLTGEPEGTEGDSVDGDGSKRDSGEVYHDAEDNSGDDPAAEQTDNIGEDPGGTSKGQNSEINESSIGDNVDKSEKDQCGQMASTNDEENESTSSELHSNNNEKDVTDKQAQDSGDQIQTDASVNSVNDKSEPV
ncbi:ARHGC-like protein [Mya arenaria]|uniref:ARHGC-like protein n=1 Tax=Mya arenaria TaxID=6604 RepID=A0ABY7E9I5_MYAAR|nr:ARHGC-like protein [Mya arenaria]